MRVKLFSITIIILMIFAVFPCRGQDNAQQQALQEAANFYMSKIRAKPNDLGLHRELMEMFSERGLISIPIAIYSASAEKYSTNPVVRYVLGYAYLLDLDPESLPMAGENLKAALDAKPEFPDALAAMGDYYLKSGKQDMAITNWKKAVEIDDRCEPAHRSLARFYRSQREYEKAVAEYLEVISLNSRSATRYLELGLTYLDMDDLDRAEQAFMKAKSYDSKLGMVYYKLGQVYAKRGDPDKAIKMYRDGRKYDPKNAGVAYELAHIFLDTGKTDYALLSMERGLSVDSVDDSLADELSKYIKEGPAAAANFMSQLANFEYSDNFQVHYFLGKLYLKLGDKGNALKHFKTASQISDSNPDVHYQLGLLQEELEPEEAKEHYQKAVELGALEVSESDEAKADLLFKTALNYLAEGQEGKFIETAKQGLALNPNRADIHLKLAEIFLKRVDIYKNNGQKAQEKEALEEAVKHYEQLTALQPDAQKWYELGLLYERQEKIKAVRAYDKAIQLDPDFALAYYRRGDFRLNFKIGRTKVLMYKPEVGVEDLQKAIQLDPKLADAHFSLGMAYHQMDMPEQATAEFEKTVEFDPKNAKAHIYLAQDYSAAGDNLKVIDHLSKAVEAGSNDVEVLKDLAAMQLKYGGDAGEKPAREALEKAYKLSPDDPEVLMNYAYTLYLNRMFNEAIEKYEKALEAQPDYPEAHYNVALAYSRIGKNDLAKVHLEKAIELAPQTEMASKAAEYLRNMKK